MKKKLMIGLLVLSLSLGISSVRAENQSNSDTFTNFYNMYEYQYEVETLYHEQYETLVQYWQTNLQQDYPYFVVFYQHVRISGQASSSYDQLSLIPFTTNVAGCVSSNYCSIFSLPYTEINNGGGFLGIYYIYNHLANSGNFTYCVEGGTSCSPPVLNHIWYSTNVNFTFNDTRYGYDRVIIPSYDNQELEVSYPEYHILTDDVIPTYLTLSEGSYEGPFTEVNLNNYDYVILSFKNYTDLISPATLYITGQLCPTMVYDFGTKEKPYGVTDICTSNYSSFTPVQLWTTSQDFDNHGVYYIKAYDTSISNIIKVPSNVFNVNYVTSENASNPTVIVGGRSYPAIPYDNLTSSATTNTEEGLIPGEVTNIFDLSSDSDFISNLFSNPLQALGSVWTSIVTMFALIGSFIGLLPVTLQAFLYTGFSLAFILGIIKILI